VRAGYSLADVYTAEVRQILGDAAKLSSKAKKGKADRRGWFKSISRMEAAGNQIVGPRLKYAKGDFKKILEALFAQIHG
jgi:hypothetical protein